MNRLGWGTPNPFNTEVTTAINKESEQGPTNGHLIEEANRAQIRRFRRIETLKMLGLLAGGILLVVIALFALGFFGR